MLFPRNFSRGITPDTQLLKAFLILNNEPLFIRQVQQTDEAEARADVGHLLLRVHALQVVDHVCEA